MTDQWLKYYYNKNNETDLLARETYYVEDTDTHEVMTDVEDDQSDPNRLIQTRRSRFWSLSSYHRVFGLYVRRNLMISKKSTGAFHLNAYHRKIYMNHAYLDQFYAIYWPVENYPYFRPANYLEATTGQYIDILDNPSRWFYQSITSMLLMGSCRGNPRFENDLQLESNLKPLLGESKQIPETNIQQYFRRSARKQLGGHVFINSSGNLMTIRTFMCYNNIPDDCPDNDEPPPPQNFYQLIKESNLSAIYPTIRNEWYRWRQSIDNTEVVEPVVDDRRYGRWIETPIPRQLIRQVYTMGLAYRRFGPGGVSVVCLGRDQPGDTEFVQTTNNEWNRDTNYSFTSATGRRDHRHYQRFSGELIWRNIAGIYDLTEPIYREIVTKYSDNYRQQTLPGNVNRCFGLYVCTGAKLVVMDDYHNDPSIDKHNRYLFEQGSVCIVEDQLFMNIPFKIRNTISDQLSNWSEFCQQFITDPDMQSKVMNFENPVIFLGANESDYNTSAWRLMIDKMADKLQEQPSRDPNNKNNQRRVITFGRRCYLEVPEGGYIVAVEDWKEGVQEIWHRHRYEQLHRAIVRHQTPDLGQYKGPAKFEKPLNDQWLGKIILNTSTEHPNGREIQIDIVRQHEDIRLAYTELLGNQFNADTHSIRPKEFNFRRFQDPIDNQLANTTNAYKVAPPAYPPVKVVDNLGQYQLLYLPQRMRFKVPVDGMQEVDYKCNLMNVFKNYPHNERTYSTIIGYNHIVPDQDGKLFLELRYDLLPEYHWERVDNPFVHKYDLLNCNNYRLGVDGQFYRKSTVHTNTIGNVQSAYYEFSTDYWMDPIVPIIQPTSQLPYFWPHHQFKYRNDKYLVDRFDKRPLLL